jgi:putative glutamine amidotransferase
MLKIGFSRATKSKTYQLYVEWLKSTQIEFEYIDLSAYSIEEALPILEDCSGLVLTGGADVHPSLYDKPNEVYRCYSDLSRDTFEIDIINKAIGLKMPILAICRGSQILNVSQGGDLIVDIEEDYPEHIAHKLGKDKQTNHHIRINIYSELYQKCNESNYEVVSFHHQAVNKLASCFRPIAFAGDKIVEAYQWRNPENKCYLNAVQFHPEMGDYMNELSQIIAVEFLKNALLFAE